MVAALAAAVIVAAFAAFTAAVIIAAFAAFTTTVIVAAFAAFTATVIFIAALVATVAKVIRLRGTTGMLRLPLVGRVKSTRISAIYRDLRAAPWISITLTIGGRNVQRKSGDLSLCG